MKEKPQSQVLLYRAPDGRTRLEARMQDETVWLTQAQMAELFGISLPRASWTEERGMKIEDGGCQGEDGGWKIEE